MTSNAPEQLAGGVLQRGLDQESTPPSFWVEMLGTEVRFRTADGRRTRSIESGQGETVVLLHGISGHAETWARNVAHLGQSYRVHALDMLGHGFTDKPSIEYSIQALGEHVLGFLDAIGAQRAHLVGQSLGGWVAGWLAIHHPDRIASLVSVTGAGLQLNEADAAITARVGHKVGEATMRAVTSPTLASVRTRLEWLVHDPTIITDELVQTRLQMYTRPDFLAIADQLVTSFTTRPDPLELLTSERLSRIACPTLVLWTKQNPTMPWSVGKRASEVIPGAAWYLMDRAGHWPQFEKPAEFNAVLGHFLESVVDRTGAWSTGGA
ncbi:MAG: alpha/beta fold hydrolase [Solirubrobacterales bacterium]